MNSPAPDTAALLSELRGIVHTSSGEARWQAIIQAVEAWPQEQLTQMALPYLMGALRADRSPRPAPKGWFDPQQATITHAAWPLVNKLNILGNGQDHKLATLAQSDALRHISELHMRSSGTSAQGIEHLVSAPFERLRVLSIAANAINDQGIITLARAPSMQHLEALYLWGNPFGAEGILALASSAYMAKLRYLDLADIPLDALAIDAIAHSPHLSQLDGLAINISRDDKEHLQRLSTSPHLKAHLKARFRAMLVRPPAPPTR